MQTQRYKTPGDKFLISVVGGGRICQGYATDKDATVTRGQLMAAAPELLAALNSILDRGLNRSTIELAEKAIQKAKK